MANYEYIKDAIVIINRDTDTPVSVEGPVVRADWYDAGEGIYGDYNPHDVDDIHLLRFDIYVKKDEEWEPVEDASYCTQVPIETDVDTLVNLIYLIYREYNNILSNDQCASVKKLGETLSWISP